VLQTTALDYYYDDNMPRFKMSHGMMILMDTCFITCT